MQKLVSFFWLLKETICLLEKPQQNKTKKPDYIQNGYLNVDSVLGESCRAPDAYLRFLSIRYMRPLMKVKAKATHARMKE